MLLWKMMVRAGCCMGGGADGRTCRRLLFARGTSRALSLCESLVFMPLRPSHSLPAVQALLYHQQQTAAAFKDYEARPRVRAGHGSCRPAGSSAHRPHQRGLTGQGTQLPVRAATRPSCYRICLVHGTPEPGQCCCKMLHCCQVVPVAARPSPQPPNNAPHRTACWRWSSKGWWSDGGPWTWRCV